ncbi:LysR family transcriptional regulator [Kocuria soli]|uniref:LysR family transcriptional regulator n=1 Tax=Kocuria soli TaxID=2485125 RepID=A0A3N3ZUX8_9MICC|nr:LysR family transcriptional regulator [Kocuria soli]ROZ62073.1 LysR family transcriptional regulator [Kocuria soli]
MLDPVKLRVLRSVVETGSIRASAEALGYTPSAVSQHLAALRHQTGLELVERSGRGVVITPAAKALADRADRALEALADVERLAQELKSGRTGSLSLAYVGSVAATWLPRVASEVRQAFPDLALTLQLRDCTQGDAAYRGDVAIVDATAGDFGPEWESTDVLEEGYVALVGATHPLAARERVALGELADLPWVTDDPLDSVWFGVIASACKAAGFTPHVEVNPSDFEAVLGFLAAGDHVSVQPSLVTQRIRADVVSIPLAGDRPRRRIQVRTRRAVAQNPAARYALECVRAVAADHADVVPGVRVL